MKILECLEKETFNELINFSFSQVREVFNLNKYFVTDEQGEQFGLEAQQLKTEYEKDLEEIEKYTEGEYTEKINSGIEVPVFEEPLFKIEKSELKIKSGLIKLITKYFNKELFQSYKKEIYGLDSFKEEIVEKPYELLISLNVHKSNIYSLLSLLGYYQRSRGYFLSRSSYLEINYKYTKEVYEINKNLGMAFIPRNIFVAKGRLKPPKPTYKKDENGNKVKIQEPYLEIYQSNKFIDIDKISLLELIRPHLQNNTQEINKIIHIMIKNFKSNLSGKEAWDKTQDEVRTLITEWESKGIMKRL